MYETITDPFCTPHELLRKAAADTVVLLKNQPKGVGLSSTKLLPLGPETKKIAVIGPNASDAVISGGGSATLRPTYVISPLDGIRNAVQTNPTQFKGVQVKYTVGVNDTAKQLLAIDPYLTPPVNPAFPVVKYVRRENMIGRMSTGTRDLALFESWDEEPTDDWMAQTPNFTKTVPEATYSTNSYTAACFFLDEDVSRGCSAVPYIKC